MLTDVRQTTADFLFQVLTSNFSLANLSKEQLVASLEVPKKLEHGHLAFPVFAMAKEMRKAPPLIAKEVSDVLTKELASGAWPAMHDAISSIMPLSGFVNITYRDSFLQKNLLTSVYDAGDRIGFSRIGAGKTLVIDYSSPNVAKPMHIGHLRATVVGQAIRNLAFTQGYNVIGLNHLGDWGVQFGKLAWAFEHWGAEYDFKNKPFDSLYQMYVRFHDEAEKNPDLDVQGSLMFKRLEQGDKEVEKVWKLFVEISMKEYAKIWGMMGVHHDLVRGESFYNDRLKPVEKMLEEKGLLEASEGAMVVRVGDDMPPCLIRKSDGASLYATRDIASAIYRHDELKADVSLYVVGADQTLHFKQVFKVLERMGFDWVKNSHHIGFGMYRFKEGKMSTRKGRTVFLEDVVVQAIELVEKVIAEKNPNLENKAEISKQVAMGAIIFNDLVSDRVRDVEFDWDKVLNFEGDSGPYVQYTYVRCMSLIRKYGKTPPREINIELTSPEERELVRLLLAFEETLSASYTTFRPNVLAQYLLEVCGAFSRFYNKHRILNEPENTEAARMALVELTRRILAQGLSTLNIEAPDAM